MSKKTTIIFINKNIKKALKTDSCHVEQPSVKEKKIFLCP